MAERLTDRGELAVAPATGDFLHIVDVSDTDPTHLAGQSKKIQFTNLLATLPSTTSNSTLNTTDKTIVGAINEQQDLFTTGLQQPLGFPNRTDSTVTYNPATRQITIAPAVTSYDYYNKTKITVSSTDVKTHADTSALYFFYYDSSNVLQFTTTAWNILTDIPIAYVYYSTDYDGGGSNDGFVAEERHSSSHNPQSHLEFHEQFGTVIISGFAIADYTVTPAVPADSDNQYSLALGVIADEDIRLSLPALPAAGPYTVLYREGSSDWKWNKTTTLPFLTSTYIVYNWDNAGTWTLTPLTTGKFTNYYILKTTSVTGEFQTIIVNGENVYDTLDLAQAETIGSVLWGNLPFQEIAPLYQITYQTSASYSSTGKCRIAATPVRILGGSRSVSVAATDHNSLSGLDLATTGIAWGHVNDQAQSIYGSKKFLDGNIGINKTTPVKALDVIGQVGAYKDINVYARNEMLNGLWSVKTLPVNNSWYHGAWAPEIGVFAAVSTDGHPNQVLTTTDAGSTWTSRTTPSSSTWIRVVWCSRMGSGLFVALAIAGTSRIMTSPDGTTWTARTVPQNNSWRDLVYSPELNRVVAVSADGTNRVMYSDDGTTWVVAVAASIGPWYAITWSAKHNEFIATSAVTNASVMYSADGITWGARSIPSAEDWIAVTWGPEIDLYVAVSQTGTNRVMTSPDGTTWTARAAIAAVAWSEVIYSSELGMFVATSATGTQQIMYSVDGITWTEIPTPANQAWRALNWIPEAQQFICLSADGSERFMSSPAPISTSDYTRTGTFGRIALSINATTTKFDIASGSAILVDRSEPFAVTKKTYFWSAITGVTATYVTTAAGSWIGIDPSLGLPITSANVVQQVTDFTREQLESVFRIGRLSHFGGTVITETFDYPKVWDTSNEWAYKHMTLGTIKVRGGKVSADGANLKLDRALIETVRTGSGTLSQINFPLNDAASQFSMNYAYRSATADRSTISGSGTDIDPSQYDSGGGSLTAVPTNDFVNLYIYFFPNIGSETVFQVYGTAAYNTYVLAIAAVGEDLEIREDIAGGIVLACVTVQEGTTNLTTAIAGGTAKITQTSKLGEF